jgi:hypothetical protein
MLKLEKENNDENLYDKMRKSAAQRDSSKSKERAGKAKTTSGKKE